MERMVAFCGLICTECEGYLATQANDEEWKERLAAKARDEYGAADATAEGVTCDGCLAFSGRLSGYCTKCEIRACSVEHQVENCGACAEYSGCEKIAGFIQMVPAVRPTLDAIHANLF